MYGAILSSLVAACNIYREVTNRGRLRVSVTLAEIHAAGGGLIATNKLWYKVTNAGRQPIWLQQIGGGFKRGMHFIISPQAQFPLKLEPGQTFDDANADAAQLDGHLDGAERVTFLGAWDTMGRIHKLPRKGLKRLLTELRARRLH